MLFNLKDTRVSFIFFNSSYNRVLYHQNFTINRNIYIFYYVTEKLYVIEKLYVVEKRMQIA